MYYVDPDKDRPARPSNFRLWGCPNATSGHLPTSGCVETHASLDVLKDSLNLDSVRKPIIYFQPGVYAMAGRLIDWLLMDFGGVHCVVEAKICSIAICIHHESSVFNESC